MKIIVSFGFGTHKELVEIAVKGLVRLAEICRADLFIPDENFIKSIPGFDLNGRDFSWYKIPLLDFLFKKGYKEILWVDSDCVVVRPINFFEEVPASYTQAFVVHSVNVGQIPNLGFWLVRQPLQPYLKEIFQTNLNHGWWEQAALMKVMGLDLSGSKIYDTPLYQQSYKMPYNWNPHIHDVRGWPADFLVGHATMWPDRKQIMEKWEKERASIQNAMPEL